jgi:hypothetical protein
MHAFSLMPLLKSYFEVNNNAENSPLLSPIAMVFADGRKEFGTR